MEYLEVGATYKFTHKRHTLKDGSGKYSYFIGKVIEDKDYEGDYRVHVIESTRPSYLQESYGWFNPITQSDDYSIRKLDSKKVEKDIMAMTNKIVLNSELKRVFIDLALATHDKEWFEELTMGNGVKV